MAWTRSTDSLLVRYELMPRYNWPIAPTVVAVQVLDRRGHVLEEWANSESGSGPTEFWPVGDGFVALPHNKKPVLIGKGTVTQLIRVPGRRPFERGDLRFGAGWLLRLEEGTVTKEQLAGCRQDSIRTDLRTRVWCLDGKKRQVAWSDNDGRSWQRHRLSDSYFAWCDGGTLGSDLTLLGNIAAIGLWRADFTRDRGRTWHDVPLPVSMVGAGRSRSPGYDPNCLRARPLADGRLVLYYQQAVVATDETNTSLSPLRTPPGTRFLDVHEGVIVAASKRPYGAGVVSYDGGETWCPVRLRGLLRHLL